MIDGIQIIGGLKIMKCIDHKLASSSQSLLHANLSEEHTLKDNRDAERTPNTTFGLTKRCSLTTPVDTNNHDNSWFPSEKYILATYDGITIDMRSKVL